MSETLTPLATFRWYRRRGEPFNIYQPLGRLQQAFRRPDSDVLIWRDVPEVFEEGDKS